MLNTSEEICSRMTLAFTASLFSLSPGLESVSNEEMMKAGLMEDDVGDSREERAFRMWINSMNVGGTNDALHIHNLFAECRDGLVLLRIMDKIEPGIVDWKRIELKPKNKYALV